MTSTGSIPFPAYFNKLSKIYPRQTGNATFSLFKASIEDLDPPITASSIVHDNAAGPATAISAVLNPATTITPQQIHITDSTLGMIEAVTDLISTQKWPTAKASVMDSHNLTFPNDMFTHSITNLSIFTFQDGVKCLQEIHRTIQPSAGVALVSTWKRFAVIEIIHRAQKIIRPDLPLMKIPHPEYMEEGYLAGQMVKAGFEESKIKIVEKSVVVKGDDRDGLVDFMAGDFTKPARTGWEDDEVKRWGGALSDAVAIEEKENGGIKFEAWIAIVKK